MRHFDETNAAKVLCYLPSRGGLYYLREEFSDGLSYVEFEQPILWFQEPLQIGEQVNIKTSFTRYFQDGSTRRGEFLLWQKAVLMNIEKIKPFGSDPKLVQLHEQALEALGLLKDVVEELRIIAPEAIAPIRLAALQIFENDSESK